MSGDNALDIDHHCVFLKQIPPLLRSPGSEGTMSHRQHYHFCCRDVFQIGEHDPILISRLYRVTEGIVNVDVTPVGLQFSDDIWNT